MRIKAGSPMSFKIQAVAVDNRPVILDLITELDTIEGWVDTVLPDSFEGTTASVEGGANATPISETDYHKKRLTGKVEIAFLKE